MGKLPYQKQESDALFKEAIIKNLGLKDISDEDLSLFATVCKQTGLNPFLRQIYLLKTSGGRYVVQLSIDGLRTIAQRSGKFAGCDAPIFYDRDGHQYEFWTSSEPPVACKVTVYVRDNNNKYAVSAVANFNEFAKTQSATWKQMPAHMLAKVAESLALRKAFPAELSGLYTVDEGQNDDIDALRNEYAILLDELQAAGIIDREVKEKQLQTMRSLQSEQLNVLIERAQRRLNESRQLPTPNNHDA